LLHPHYQPLHGWLPYYAPLGLTNAMILQPPCFNVVEDGAVGILYGSQPCQWLDKCPPIECVPLGTLPLNLLRTYGTLSFYCILITSHCMAGYPITPLWGLQMPCFYNRNVLMS
ncbi:MAG: hypothetical protein Q4D30_12385, partial [Bacteroidales bacterium]|nr:hypothetical protein [Bacteroidales bacterium]